MERQTETSRVEALGEIAALVVHDLSAPIHTIRFCTEQLQESPEKGKSAKYLEQLAVNGQRVSELVESLRSYLRSSVSSDFGIPFGEMFRYTKDYLAGLNFSRGFDKVAFEVDPRLLPVRIRMTKADFTHVLTNLLQNSLENMLSREVPDPLIHLTLEELTSTSAVIGVRDTGSGLSESDFQVMTSVDNYTPHKSPGLRLIRRLLERHGGTLSWAPLPEGCRGTKLLIKTAVLEPGSPNAR